MKEEIEEPLDLSAFVVLDELEGQPLKIVVRIDRLMPEFLAAIKADVEDVQGWKKHRKVMKDHGYDIGAVEIE